MSAIFMALIGALATLAEVSIYADSVRHRKKQLEDQKRRKKRQK